MVDRTPVGDGETMTPLDNALSLAGQHGFHVFPLRIFRTAEKLEKRPFKYSAGYLDATNDLDRIRKMGALAESWLKPNEELAFGIVPGRSGLVVIDLDTHVAGKNGVQYAAENIDLPPTFKVATATGNGLHLYYRKRDLEKLISNSTPFGENSGIDIRADSGYVVAPGTLTKHGEWSPTHDSNEFGDYAEIPQKVWAQLSEKGTDSQPERPFDATALVELPKSVSDAIGESIARVREVTKNRQRSDEFHNMVKLCVDNSLNIDTTFNAMRTWDNVYRKYVTDDKVWAEVWRSFDKHKARRGVDEYIASLPIQDSPTMSDVQQDAPPKFVALRGADIEPKEIEWLIDDLMPEKEVVLFIGSEGIGKGLYTCHLAAQLTTGENPVNVLFIAAEDDANRILRPRLDAAGANPNRWFVMGQDAETLSNVPLFPTHEKEIERIVTDNHIKVIFVDPWLSTVPGKLSVKDSQQARQVLDPWTRFVRRLGITVVAVSHTNRTNGSTRDRVASSGVLRQVARVQLLAIQDPEKPESVWIGIDKSNLGELPPAVEYRKESFAGSVRAVPTGSSNFLTIAEIDATFNTVRDGRTTDKFQDVTAAADGGIITRKQIVEIYKDAGDPAVAANSAIHRWTHSTPPKLTKVRGQRGVFEVTS